MNKYTVVYTANDRYDSQIDYPTSRVEYIQGETLDKAIDQHIKHMKGWAIHNIHGEVIFLEGHIKQVDIGHGIGHAMGSTHTDVIITDINNSKIKFNEDGEVTYD
jgi:23S rRNA U2552 (ribose-2'-O)-methylase RlmE/FtsJ